MTTTNDKLRSLILSALMVFSVFAGSVAFAGTAAADTSGNDTITGVSFTAGTTLDASSGAADVQTQTLELTAHNDGESEEVEIDVSEATDNGLTVDSVDASGLGADASQNGDTILVNFDGTADTGTITVNIGWNVTEAENDNRLDHVVSATNDDNDETASFKVTGEYSQKIIQGTDTSASIFGGEVIQLEAADSDTQIEIYSTDDDGNADTRESNLNTGMSNVINYDSSNLDTGEKYIVQWGGSSGSDDVSLTVNNLGLDAEADSTSITTESSVDVTASSQDPNGDYTARILNDDGDEVDNTEQTGTFDGSGAAEISFDSLDDVGNYTVEVEHDATGITSETDTINVSEAGSEGVDFENDVVQDQIGDVADIPIQLENTDKATITIGSEETNYWIVAQVEDENDDGEVIVQFNSYTAGAGAETANDKITADGKDSVTIVEEGGEFTDSSRDVGEKLLGTTEYEMNITSGHNDGSNADTVGALSLQQRETTGISTWTAPGGADVSDWDADTIAAGIGSNVTQASDIANGDYAVFQLNAEGLEGAFEYQSSDNSTDAFLNNDETLFALEHTNPKANADPKDISLSGGNTVVVSNADNNTYYVAVDTDETNADTNRDYKSNFTVEGSSVLNTNDGDNEVVTSKFGVVEGESELNTNQNDLVTVEAGSDQKITGTSTWAPGTELSITVKSTDSTSPFLTRPDATIKSNGTFTATADFSKLSPGTNLTFQIKGEDKVDGKVVEQKSENTETATPDNSTATPSPTPTPVDTTETTETTETTDDSNEKTTDNSGPGFTIVAALGALIAAALLAARRSN